MSSYTIGRIDKVYRTYTGTFTDSNGNAITPASVDVVAVPRRNPLASGMTWTTVTLSSGKMKILYAGPSADPTSATVVVPIAGCDVYARVTDTPEIQATKIDTIIVN